MNALAVITGATKGIGYAIATRFARAGMDLAICARRENDLQEVKKQWEALGVSVYAMKADVSDKTQALAFAQFVTSLHRSVDVLVNNAGHFIPGETMTEPEGTLEDMIASNVYSAYYVARGLAEVFKAQRRGHIFNMCSIASLKAYPNGGSYAISKFALLGFSKVLREELKPHGVRVTAVMPGATRTASWDGVDLPEERFMKPEDVADVVYQSYAISTRSVVEEIILRPQLGDI